MNRSNVGNVVTNAVQIGSVGLTTASGVLRHLGSADTTLSNLSKDERKQYRQMKADKMRDEIKTYSQNKATEVKETVDDYMKDVEEVYVDNSPQMSNIQNKLSADREFLNDWSKPVDENFIEDLINKGEI